MRALEKHRLIAKFLDLCINGEITTTGIEEGLKINDPISSKRCMYYWTAIKKQRHEAKAKGW